MLAQALAAYRVHRAVLVIAKLDRLARNVSFVSALMDAGVEFVAWRFPSGEPTYHPHIGSGRRK